MKKTLILLLLLSISLASYPIDNYPKGCYMSYEEIVKKMPSKTLELTLVTRTKSDIKMNGGNDYKFLMNDKSIKRKFLKKEMWAYSDGNSLYLNCRHFKMQNWYSKIIYEQDDKFVLVAGIILDKKTKQKIATSGILFGAIGGAITGAKLSLKRFLYTIDKSTKEVNIIELDNLKKILASKPTLLSKLESDEEKEDAYILAQYLISFYNTEE